MKLLIKKIISSSPFLDALARNSRQKLSPNGKKSAPFPGSEAYWEQRYAHGSHSGAGSYSYLAEFKAGVINSFVQKHHVERVIEFGCGDGNQLRLAEYPTYLGFDISSTAISQCRAMFDSDTRKTFKLAGDYSGETADLVLSLDVIYHLVEDHVFERYMRMLFEASSKYVIIYSSDFESSSDGTSEHVRHRKFTDWINRNQTGWILVQHVPNRHPYDVKSNKGSLADFFIFEARSSVD